MIATPAEAWVLPLLGGATTVLVHLPEIQAEGQSRFVAIGLKTPSRVAITCWCDKHAIVVW